MEIKVDDCVTRIGDDGRERGYVHTIRDGIATVGWASGTVTPIDVCELDHAEDD
jgi:hypothetical protein